jgi:catechol 2,3-dioxygenase-like lactoylglutathione lyase family enzyme
VKNLICLLALLAAAAAMPARAQLPAPNEAGVTMGHLHLNVKDVEANKKFWIAMGGKPIKVGAFDVFKFPGVLVFLRDGQPTGPSVGSIINHAGFRVPNVQKSLAKWQEAGLNAVAGGRPTQAFVTSPEGLRLEILEDAEMKEPIASHHIHFFVTESAIPEIQAWYAKTFGAQPGKRGDNQSDDIPGENLTFSKSPEKLPGTQGRALDHIGFEVKNLEAFCKKLEASGVKFDRPFSRNASGLALAFLTDPWGTYIELNEGLAQY